MHTCTCFYIFLSAFIHIYMHTYMFIHVCCGREVPNYCYLLGCCLPVTLPINPITYFLLLFAFYFTDCLASSYWERIGLNDEMRFSLDPSSLSLLPGYVDLLRSFIMHHLSQTETLSRKTCLYLVKLECLADLCV